MRQRLLKPFFSFLLLSVFSGSAYAHHPLGGQTPQTLWHGLLSGLGHPLIGVDHLLFVIAAGLLALRYSGRYLLPLAFAATTAVGTGALLFLLNLA